MSQSSPQLAQQLTEAYQAIQQGQPENALRLLQKVLRKFPLQPDALHLAALAHKAGDQFAEAEKMFKRCLAVNARQAQVHNNLANLYKQSEQYKKAEEHYLQALSIDPNFGAASKNLALCLSAQNKFEKAKALFLQLLERSPEDASLHCGLGDCYRYMENLEDAISHYEKATSISPEHATAWHNLGVCHHLSGRLVQALECYQTAYATEKSKPEIAHSLANALYESGRAAEALQLLRETLKTVPGSALLHQRLNELYWELGQTHEFGDSYVQAISQGADHLQLRVNQVSQLFRAGLINPAVDALSSALVQFPDSAELWSLQGQVFADQGETEQATTALEKSLQISFAKDAAHSLVKLHVLGQDYLAAQRILDDLMRFNANCQLTWALQSLLWRLIGDGRYTWLNNYREFVREFIMPVPHGYNSLAEFLAALKIVLLEMHKARAAPLEQTLRNGTQTAARLLHSPAPEIRALKESLTTVVQSYIRALPEDPSHPLLRRKSDNFEFSGSWSVLLAANGYHVNHVHPAGWLSSSCYIELPDRAEYADSADQGAIKFGESPLQLGELEVIEKTIQPEPGMVVLFPSYMWHGTIPFSGSADSFRLTAPFDVVPA